MDEQNRQMEDSGPPEGFPKSEVVVLHDGAEKSLVVFFFENEEDYAKADEMLNAMPTGDAPGSPHVGDEVRRRHPEVHVRTDRSGRPPRPGSGRPAG